MYLIGDLHVINGTIFYFLFSLNLFSLTISRQSKYFQTFPSRIVINKWSMTPSICLFFVLTICSVIFWQPYWLCMPDIQFFFLFVFCFQMALHFLSWNICGLNKLLRYPVILERIRDFQIIFIQESLQIVQSFAFPGFARYDVPAVPTGGRTSGGLMTLLSNASFLDYGIEVLLAEEFLQLLLCSSSSGFSMILGNVYIPRSSGR